MKILVFAPHNDDETLGVGGTIAKYSAMGEQVYVCEVTSGKNKAIVNQIKEEALSAHQILGVKNSIFLDLPVVALKDTETLTINKAIQEVVKMVKPNIAFIPHRGDIHIDHTEVSNACMVALRPIENPQLKAIYAYETLSETEWNIPSAANAFIPNSWNPIDKYLEQKIKAMSCYKSQLKQFPNPRSLEGIEALAKYRGTTIGVNAAESFILIRQRFE